MLANFGSEFVRSVIRTRPWKCFFCDPELMKVPLSYYRTFKDAVLYISKENIANQPWPEQEEISIHDGPTSDDASDDEDNRVHVSGVNIQ